jgi:hypothetical protein
VKDGGDAIGEGLSIALEQRNIDWKSDPWPRHHLSLECIAVDVDDPGKHQKAGRIDGPLGARFGADAGDDPGVGIEMNACLLETAVDERATLFNAHAHDLSR